MSETRSEVAERIVRETMLVVPGKIADKYIDAIEAALKDRDERAAKIAEAMCPSGGRLWTAEQSACFSALTDCAGNIRNENTQHFS